ncbi:MAG TPA: hypothetical protein VGJ13_11895 [Pseudonocardiaceae bacterium]|jgi:hypothetical protein
MWRFLLGGAIGYVLGSRAGRERYAQLERAGRQVIDHPAVQSAVGVAVAKVTELTGGRVGGTRNDRAQPPSAS